MQREAEPSRRTHLVLVGRSRRGGLADFERIAGIVRASAPDVIPFVINDRTSLALLPRLALRPTLVVSLAATERFRPLRGRVIGGEWLPKSAEYRELDRAGLPVPRWAVLGKGDAPDLSDFGEYVVLKPDLAGRGAEVKIRRRGRVRWRPPPLRRGIPNESWIVQEFVYTGRWPVSYRVTTFFGRTLFAWRCEADRSRRPLEGFAGFRGGASRGGISIVSGARGCSFALEDAPDILSLAERCHAAFPDQPLLGVDIVRDHETGRLWILEVNSGGETWHFTSRLGREIQETFGLDFEKQFDGIRRAAQVLVERSRALAM